MGQNNPKTDYSIYKNLIYIKGSTTSQSESDRFRERKKTQKTVAEKRQMLWLLLSQGVLCLSCSPHLKYWQFSKDLAQTTELAQQEGLFPFLYNPTHDPCPPTCHKVCKRGWRQGPCVPIFVLIKHASPWNDGI